MMLTAKIWEVDGTYSVCCDALDIVAQGVTRQAAVKSLAACVEMALDLMGYRDTLAVITDDGGSFLDVSATDPAALVACAQRRLSREAAS